MIANARISCECIAATECIALKVERAGFVSAVDQDPYLWLRMAQPAIAKFGDLVFQVAPQSVEVGEWVAGGPPSDMDACQTE